MATAHQSFELDSVVDEFLQRSPRLWIGGEWRPCESGRTFETRDPSTGEVVSEVAEGGAKDIDLAVASAREAFERGPWRDLSPSARGHAIWKLADLIEARIDQFAQLETLDNGKPLSVAKTRDVPSAVDLLRYMAGWATKIEGQTIPLSAREGRTRYFAYTLREPVGVVGQIIPWNFPLLMAAWKLGPALACGCTVVLKPAEQTPLSALLLADLIAEAGIPAGVVNIVPGFGEIAGAALAAHPDVDKIAFTGSTEVGRLIVNAAAGNLKKVSLELGGKSPNIVFADANLESAIDGATDAAFFNQGQCCSAGSRLYVEESVFDRVVSGVAERASRIRLGRGFEPGVTMGPVVSQEQLDRVCGYIESGLKEGANAVTGGHRWGDRGYFVEPTLLIDTDSSMRVVREEIFGPVVCAMPFQNEQELLVEAHRSEYGLAAAIWTRDVARAHALAESLRAGTVWINCYNVADAALPFGGYRQSGWGREMGREALELYSQVKAVCSAIDHDS